MSGIDSRRCLDCDYPLRGLPEPRCPECGRPFDPQDPNSYFEPPPKDYLSPRECLAMAGIPFLLFAASVILELVVPGAALFGVAAFISLLTAAGATLESVRAMRDPEIALRERYRAPLVLAAGVMLLLLLAVFGWPLC